MTGPIGLADLTAYLEATGWRPTGETWRGAAVWGHDDVEVLVPVRDDLQDNSTRLREALEIVADSEGRTPADVAVAMSRAHLDAAVHRREPSGPMPLSVGEGIVGGLHALLRTAARTAVEGQHLRFGGAPPPAVSELVGRSSLALDDDSLAVLVPAGPLAGADPVTGRDVTLQMFDAVVAAADAAATGDPAAFDRTIGAGVSAELCTALGDLAGVAHREPFSVGFGWAVGRPAPVAPRVIEFPRGAGVTARVAAARLRRLDVSGDAVVEGRVDGLHDEAGGPDRRRVRVRGLLRTGVDEREGRALWVRLGADREYDRMVQAYRSGRPVRVAGELTSRDGRVELSVPAEGIEIESEDESGQ